MSSESLLGSNARTRPLQGTRIGTQVTNARFAARCVEPQTPAASGAGGSLPAAALVFLLRFWRPRVSNGNANGSATLERPDLDEPSEACRPRPRKWISPHSSLTHSPQSLPPPAASVIHLQPGRLPQGQRHSAQRLVLPRGQRP